jgi:hypothetical protein
MIKKTILAILTLGNILALIYLLTPVPLLPDLPNSIKSDLPGDTVQIPNTTAFFTNMTRTEVINFYQASFSGPFRIIINHPPERARQIWQDTINSYYLEEFILPFKQSLYVNGFEWEKDVYQTGKKNSQQNRISRQRIPGQNHSSRFPHSYL